MSLLGKRKIKVSAKSARLRFIECGPQCIATGCTGRCCDAPTSPDGIRVSVLPSEREGLELLGARIVDGFIKPRKGERVCPFKTKGHLCSLHNTGFKPFGCTVSPFMLNKHGTLIIRNRYKLLPCYDPKGEPAYRVFSSSLVLLFGKIKTDSLTEHLDEGGGDITIWVSDAIYKNLSGREEALQNQTFLNKSKRRLSTSKA